MLVFIALGACIARLSEKALNGTVRVENVYLHVVGCTSEFMCGLTDSPWMLLCGSQQLLSYSIFCKNLAIYALHQFLVQSDTTVLLLCL